MLSLTTGSIAANAGKATESTWHGCVAITGSEAFDYLDENESLTLTVYGWHGRRTGNAAYDDGRR